MDLKMKKNGNIEQREWVGISKTQIQPSSQQQKSPFIPNFLI